MDSVRDFVDAIASGDNLEADVQGAIDIGMKAIHCNFEHQEINTNGIISITSLLEIKQYL